MLNRRHIRVKVMQTLYAFKGSESDDLSKDQKFLLFSIDNMYSLYLLLISLFIEVQKRAEDDLQKKQKKHLATKEDINPNRKFVENKLLHALKDNLELNNLLELHKITNWNLDGEYVDIIFKAIDLFKKTLLNKTAITKEIDERTQNWDSDRIANIDYVLLQMGICELKNFSSIPVKVTINEYLEIAKEYSTPKSSIFINGILDKLVKEYEAEGTLKKIGRGLL